MVDVFSPSAMWKPHTKTVTIAYFISDLREPIGFLASVTMEIFPRSADKCYQRFFIT